MSEIVQINSSMDQETAEMLDIIGRDLGYDNRSAVVRFLIRQEYKRRFGVQKPEPSAVMTDCIEQ